MLGSTNISGKNMFDLSISLNGSLSLTYNGNTKQSLNITAASIGAALANHNHDDIVLNNFSWSGRQTWASDANIFLYPSSVTSEWSIDFIYKNNPIQPSINHTFHIWSDLLDSMFVVRAKTGRVECRYGLDVTGTITKNGAQVNSLSLQYSAPNTDQAWAY